MSSIYEQKIYRNYATTQISGKYVDSDMSIISVLRKAIDEKNMWEFKKNIKFCIYKTEFENKDAILMQFIIESDENEPPGSSGFSDKVMFVVGLLERMFMPIDYYRYHRDVDGVGKNSAVLRIIKITNEDDLL